MDTEQKELAEAADALTVEDFRYLEEKGMLEESSASENSRARNSKTLS